MLLCLIAEEPVGKRQYTGVWNVFCYTKISKYVQMHILKDRMITLWFKDVEATMVQLNLRYP